MQIQEPEHEEPEQVKPEQVKPEQVKPEQVSINNQLEIYKQNLEKLSRNAPTQEMRMASHSYLESIKQIELSAENFRRKAEALPQEYKQSTFKCLNDFRTCQKNGENPIICGFFTVACLAKELLPLAGGGE